MHGSDHSLLREMDAAVAELARERSRRFEAGAHLARVEAAALTDLAEAIGRSLEEWRDLLAEIDLTRAFDGGRAGRLVLESVFDEVLSAAPWRVLAAAVALGLARQ